MLYLIPCKAVQQVSTNFFTDVFSAMLQLSDPDYVDVAESSRKVSTPKRLTKTSKTAALRTVRP
jgi:hypothetical protein